MSMVIESLEQERFIFEFFEQNPYPASLCQSFITALSTALLFGFLYPETSTHSGAAGVTKTVLKALAMSSSSVSTPFI
jgi:hypothetical protein